MHTLSQLAATRWLALRNDASETIPPFAVTRVTGASRDTTTGVVFLTVAKPNTTEEKSYLVNGPTRVLAGGYGSGTFEPAMALYDTSDGTPALGEIWGPKSGQWTLDKTGTGFAVLGAALSDSPPRVFVREYRTPTTGNAQLYSPQNYTATSKTKLSFNGAYPAHNAMPSAVSDDITLAVGGAWQVSLSLHIKGSNTGAPTHAVNECLVQVDRTRGGLIVTAKGVHVPRINSTHPFVDIECRGLRDDYEAGDVLTAYMTCAENITLRDGSFDVTKL